MGSKHPFHTGKERDVMFEFINRKPKKKRILEKRYKFNSFEDFLKSLSNSELRELGKTVVYSNCDGYNLSDCESKMIYFDNLDRWQKEFFIDQRRYYL